VGWADSMSSTLQYEVLNILKRSDIFQQSKQIFRPRPCAVSSQKASGSNNLMISTLIKYTVLVTFGVE
jgi:hypothetical protein